MARRQRTLYELVDPDELERDDPQAIGDSAEPPVRHGRAPRVGAFLAVAAAILLLAVVVSKLRGHGPAPLAAHVAARVNVKRAQHHSVRPAAQRRIAARKPGVRRMRRAARSTRRARAERTTTRSPRPRPVVQSAAAVRVRARLPAPRPRPPRPAAARPSGAAAEFGFER